MKHLKILALPIFMAAVFFSCKKSGDVQNVNQPQASEVTVKNGIVTFSSIAAYLKTTENKNGEQAKLEGVLKTAGFKSLKSKAAESAPASVASSTSNIAIITTAFDSSLYSQYLLSILNTDKICSVNGFLVKVDMDNVFCSAIDETLYPGSYNDLKNNVFTNANVMTFTDANEPVVDVLDGIRNATLTWVSYQDQLSKKGGQGICLARGAKGKKDVETVGVQGSNGQATITASADYGQYFLHFELVAAIGAVGTDLPIAFFGRYDWNGVCKGWGNGTYNYPNNNIYVPFVHTLVLYSGGSALATNPKLEANASIYYNGILTKVTASIYY